MSWKESGRVSLGEVGGVGKGGMEKKATLEIIIVGIWDARRTFAEKGDSWVEVRG
jgi:hypothetical protein